MYVINNKNLEGLNELGCDTIRCKKIICEEIQFVSNEEEHKNKYISLGLDVIDRRSEMGDSSNYLNYNLTMKNNIGNVYLAFNKTNVLINGELNVTDGNVITGTNVKYLDQTNN